MTGALDLGNLYSKVIVDFGQLAKAEAAAMRFAKTSVREFNRAEQAAKGFKNAGKAITAFGATAAVGLGAATKASLTFSETFLDVSKNVKGLNDVSTGDFRKEILELGRSSLIGASGIATLVSEGGKLGESAKGALEFAKVSEQIAVAFDFGESVEAAQEAGQIVGKIRSSFGLSTNEVLKFADAFNYFGDNTASTAKKITQIIGRQGATIANATNLTQGELAALAASFDAVSPSAQIAATGMKNMVLSLAIGEKATDEAAASMKQLGFDSGEMAQMLKDDAPAAILAVLEAISKVDEAKQAGITMKLFGRESIGAISPLIGNLKLLKQNFKLAGDSSKFLGSVKKEYDRLNESDGAKLTKAMSSLNVSMIQVGDVLAPILAQVAVGFSQLLSAADALDPGLVRIGVLVTAAAAGVALLVGPLLIATGSLVSMVAAAGGVSAMFAMLAAAAGPVTLVLGVLAAGAYLIYKNWDSLVKFFQSAFTYIVESFMAWKQRNAETIAAILEAWEDIKTSGIRIFNAVVVKVQEFIVWLDKALEPIGGLQGAWEVFGKTVGVIWDIFLVSLKGGFDIIKGVFENIANYLEGNQTGWETFTGIVGSLIKGLHGIVKGTFVLILDYLKTLPDKMMEAGKNLMIGLAIGIKNAALAPVDAVIDAGKGIIDATMGIFDERSPSKVFAQIGRYTMVGLAMGIAEAAPLATKAAEDAAAKTILAFEKSKGGQSDDGFGFGFSGPGGDPSFGGGGFGGAPAGFPELEEIANYYDQRLSLLTEKGQQETELYRAIELQKTNATANAKQDQIAIYSGLYGSLLGITKTFAGEQSGIYKVMFAASKAFAIADSIVKIQQGIANAAALPFPGNIGAMASVAAATANIVSTIGSVAAPKAFYNGGRLGSGQTGVAGEKGVEIVGPTGIISTQKTKELFAGGSGSGATTINVEIINNAPVKITTKQTSDGDGEKLQFIIDAVAEDFASGEGKISQSAEQAYGLSRKGL